MNLLLVWLINAVALLGVAFLIPSIHVSSFGAALIAALLLGLVNALVRPVLIVLTLPVTVLTLGVFILVINGLLFWFVGSILRGFVVQDFGTAFFGALCYSLISWALSWLLLAKKQ
ncbi:MAG TPA: phage holin family protein [Rhodocyclaceae bacterium]|nr:phage holin family protein [Rhodocyclaceae bacterium]